MANILWAKTGFWGCPTLPIMQTFLVILESKNRDIKKERARIGGDWAIATVISSRSLRDLVRYFLFNDSPCQVLPLWKQAWSGPCSLWVQNADLCQLLCFWQAGAWPWVGDRCGGDDVGAAGRHQLFPSITFISQNFLLSPIFSMHSLQCGAGGTD